jgi:mono/diheme cytochrome c family protein
MVLSLALFAAEAVRADAPNAVYDKNCALCHQKGGAGLSGQVPRLAGRVGKIAATDAGRRYLINVVLFGMAGKVDVDSAAIVGVMPSFASLSDDDLAAVLNYVTHLEGGQMSSAKSGIVNAADVTGVRVTQKLTPTQVHTLRESVPGLKASP